MFDFWFLDPDLDFGSIITILCAYIFSIIVFLPLREMSHIWLSHLFSGRKFNFKNYPLLEFFDPLGAFFMMLFGYGWARRFNYFLSEPANRLEYVLVYLIGPVFTLFSSIFLKVIINILILVNFSSISWSIWIIKFLHNLIDINVTLTVVEMMPVPPLDGFKICEAFIPQRYVESYLRYQSIIWMILSLMLFIGFFRIPIGIMKSLVYGLVYIVSNIPFLAFK